MMRLTALLALLAVVASATELTLKEKIALSLEEHLSIEAQGIENCENKCEKSFNRLAYQISATDGRRTHEFQACVLGCNQCQADLAADAEPDNCFKYCKNYDWLGNGIFKGVIEPDKACE